MWFRYVFSSVRIRYMFVLFFVVYFSLIFSCFFLLGKQISVSSIFFSWHRTLCILPQILVSFADVYVHVWYAIHSVCCVKVMRRRESTGQVKKKKECIVNKAPTWTHRTTWRLLLLLLHWFLQFAISFTWSLTACHYLLSTILALASSIIWLIWFYLRNEIGKIGGRVTGMFYCSIFRLVLNCLDGAVRLSANKKKKKKNSRSFYIQRHLYTAPSNFNTN